MQNYCAPIDDYRFLLSSVLDFDRTMTECGMEADVDLAVAVLEEGGRLCANILHPINRSGDEEGSRLIDGAVKTPAGFPDAYRKFVAGGWASLSADPAHGGQGLPQVLQVWFDEMMSATNLSFGIFPSLTRGASEAIAAHANEDLKTLYLPRMVSGEWTGAMALTESGAGSDLTLLKTKAVENGDGSFSITGQKIFISSGDHDFGGNVIHLVLARLSDAPAGTRGISLFLVPKFLADERGAFESCNAMSVGALEKKMGIHAQPTCVMNYDGATGWMIGEANRGLAAMFTMMNTERLMVGVQGLGIAGGAYQQAVAYARDRLQGRGLNGQGPVPIIEHADVRRMLLAIDAFAQAARALAGFTALQLDRGRLHPDEKERGDANALVALLTPVIKAAFTDFGFESAVHAQQIFGGHGYLREWGIEQFVRDARISPIYEGTNGIQAIDLVSRKLALRDGATAKALFALISADLARVGQGDGQFIALRTTEALDLLSKATADLAVRDPDTQGAVATDYLRLFALTCFGWMWARIAAAASGDDAFHRRKRLLATFFAERMLPQVRALSETVGASIGVIRAFDAADF